MNRVSRFTASSTNPDVAEPGSETFILNPIPSETGWHNGGAIHFGNDGKLYVAVGEGHHEDNAQSLATLSGKLLRINADGTIPLDNPFYGSTSGNNRAIWSLGLRNPFTFDIQPTTGRIFINDVGENAYEEINEAWVGPNNGFERRLQLRLARHRGAARRPALPQPVPRLSAGRRRLRDHGRCVLQPGDRSTSRPSTWATTSSPTTAPGGSRAST